MVRYLGLGALIVLGVVSCAPSPEKAAIDRAEQALKNQMKDPYSVVFSNIRARAVNDHTVSVCGEFNAKNSYGAYVGSKRFYATVFKDKEFPIIPFIDDSDTSDRPDLAKNYFDDGWKKNGC